MANTLNLGNGNWATKEDSLLAYNSENGNFKPLAFNFTRASSATVVNKDGLIETVGSGEPRIDFSNDAKGALLLEPTRSNLITYSEDFTTWSGSGYITSNYAISPNGTQNASRCLFTGANQVLSRTSTLSTSVSCSATFYVKGVSGETIRLAAGGADTIHLLNGSWQRIETNKTSINSTIVLNTFGGATARDLLIWGAQLEQGSYATSYIPTSGSAVTRSADSSSQTVPSGIIGQTEGSVFFDLNTTLKNYSVISISDGTNANRVVFYFSAVLNQIASYITKSNVNSSTISSIVNSYPNSNHKVVIKYNSIGFYVFANGQLIGTILSDYSFTNNTLSEIKFSSPDNSNFFEGNVKDIRIYNTALTNQEAIALTTI